MSNNNSNQGGSLGLGTCVAMIAGGMIGSSIFSLSGLTMTSAGPSAILTWAIAAVIMLCYGLICAELSTRFPKSGGVFVFPSKALGKTEKEGALWGWISTWGYIIDNRISRPDWIQRHDPAEMRASLTTPLQNRGRNLIRGERRPHKQETSRFTLALPAFKPDFVFSFEFSKLTEKAESKYRPVATISQIEIASHAPVVLVREYLPQTLLTFRALRVLRLCRHT